MSPSAVLLYIMLLVNYSKSGNLDLQVKIEIRQITSDIREIMLLVQNGIIYSNTALGDTIRELIVRACEHY